MMSFAWKVLVPLVLALVLWQMLALKLPIGTTLQYLLVLLGNIAVIGIVARVLGRHLREEQVRTKPRL